MKPDLPFTFKRIFRKHLRSYKYALIGIISIFVQQLNFKIELLISLCVITIGLILQISSYEWIAILFSITLVLIAESLNTAIEAICDAVHKHESYDIKYAKDIAAGAVLLSAGAAVIVGMIIFLPHLGL